MKRIAITGGCGFQGSHLAESYAEEGHYVRILNTPSQHAMGNYTKYLKRYDNIDVIWGSVNDSEVVNKTLDSMDIVFHLAAKVNVDESIKFPLEHAKTNVIGTSKVLRSAYAHQQKFVHASSCEVYGQNILDDINVYNACVELGIPVNYVSSAAGYGKLMQNHRYAMNEYHPLNPQSPYAASKCGGDRMAYAFYHTYGLRVTIVRPFNIFGPRQKRYGFGAVIPIFFRLAACDQTLTVHGDGSQTRDYLYVDDLVDGYRIIAESEELEGEAVNFGSGMQTTVAWLAEEIVKIVGRGKIQYGEERPGEVDSFVADNTKIERYGFKPKVSMPDGLQLYWDWYKDGPMQEDRHRAGLKND